MGTSIVNTDLHLLLLAIDIWVIVDVVLAETRDIMTVCQCASVPVGVRMCVQESGVMMQVLVLAFTALVTVAGAGEPSILSIPSTPPAAGTRQISAPPCQTTCHVSSVECDTCDYEQERISV